MKRLFLTVLAMLLLAATTQAQQRDRRVDLDIYGITTAGVSSTGRLWLASRSGQVFTADNIGATWRTIENGSDDLLYESDITHLAAFGDSIAVVALGPHDNSVLRTTGSLQWDTVPIGRRTPWIKGFHYTADGHLWIGSGDGLLTYSADSGRTFTVLRDSTLDIKIGIEDIYMLTPDSGWIAGHGNRIYTTHNNWRTFRRWTTPLDQKLYTVTNPHDQYWVNQIRPWKGYLVARQAQKSFYASLNGSMQWKQTPLPLVDIEVDTVHGGLWAVTDSGQLLLMQDMEHWQVVRTGIKPYTDNICGTLGGAVYLHTMKGIVRVAPDGHADTCGLYTTEQTLEEVFAESDRKFEELGLGKHEDPILRHGGREWYDFAGSIFLRDSIGWYRIAAPEGLCHMHPDPDRDDRVVILAKGLNYSVDTAGHVEPYTYRQPLESFVASGLQNVKIATYFGGCFHYQQHAITYTRDGDLLRETANTVDSNRWITRHFPAVKLEQALLRIGQEYSRFPTPGDFGLPEGSIDLKKVFTRYLESGCTSYAGYGVTFVNRQGDTLTVYGNSDADCGNYFPWLLPMHFAWREARFDCHLPLLWQTLKPMMPDSMDLRDMLDNSSLVDIYPADLLFFRDTAGMGNAIAECTGEYTHVAIVEKRKGNTVWVIDATPQHGVSRRKLTLQLGDRNYPDIYRANRYLYEEWILDRAREFIGQPYDHAFLPDNGALYCSELVYECYLDNQYGGGHLFEAKPMNWRDAKGKLPRYWKRHFKKLKMPVPEGVPGTNPTDLARSPLLQKL